MPPTARSVPQHRQQKFGTQLDTEWPEWKPFPYMFKKKHLIKAQRIRVEIHWEKLISSPNAKVTTTREEGHTVSKGLALLDDKSTAIFLSADPDPQQLAVYIPGGAQLPWCQKKGFNLPRVVEDAIDTYTKAATPPKPNKDKRHEVEQWKKHKGLWGVYHLGYWHAQGQSHKPPVLCADMLRTATIYSATLAFFRSIGPLAQTVGMLLQQVDPEAYALYRSNYESQCKASALGQFRVSNRSCFHCLAVLVNAQVGPHKDSGDVREGWVAMACFGNFKGGELCLPALGYKVPFQPGDVVLFRSAVLEHWIEPFNGTRYSCVFFTKSSSWKPD